MQTINRDTWSDISQPYDIVLSVMKRRSPLPVFRGSVILPCILKTIWWMNIKFLDNQSAWSQNNYRSQCPLFHCLVILPYTCILKILDGWTSKFWIRSQYNTAVDLNKCRSLWPIFRSPVILSYILEDYLIDEHQTFRKWVCVTQPLTSR